MWRLLLLAPMLACGACDSIPADVEGTLTRVERDGRFRVGIVQPTARRKDIRRYVAGVAKAAGARPVVRTAPAETLLLELEQGRLDLIVAEMDRKTPWAKRVFLLPALATTRVGTAQVDLVPVARNGENRWTALLDAQARSVAR